MADPVCRSLPCGCLYWRIFLFSPNDTQRNFLFLFCFSGFEYCIGHIHIPDPKNIYIIHHVLDRTFRNKEKNSQWDNQEVDLTAEMKSLLEHYYIDIHGNLKDAISAQTDKAFFTGLLHILKLTLQMRNSITGTETDYLVSPVADENGIFYDSRSCGDELPENADANGAYNIARKGLMMIEQIKEAKDLDNLKFDISNKSWLNFAQQKPYKNG